MHDSLEWASIGFGAISAALWAWAAFNRVPRLSVPYGGIFRDDHPWVVATERVARLSRWASAVTALAVACQTAAAIAEKISG